MNAELKNLIETKVAEAIGKEIIFKRFDRSTNIEKFILQYQINGLSYFTMHDIRKINLYDIEGIEIFLTDIVNQLSEKLNDRMEQLTSFFREFDIELTNDRVLNFIEVFKGIDESSRELMEEIYMRGDCGRFHLILNLAFPEAVPYVFKGKYFLHVLSKIDGRYYDIKGLATFERFKDEEGYEEAFENAKTLEDAIREVTLSDVIDGDMFNNYSFEYRGPIL